MQVSIYSDARRFKDDVQNLLAQNEVLNNVPLGVLQRGIECGEDTGKWFMAKVGGIVALMTPPYNLLIANTDTHISQDALCALSAHIVSEHVQIPGIACEKALAAAFADTFTRESGRAHMVKVDERGYVLETVENVAIIGELRLADARDDHYLPYWIKGFSDEALLENTPIDIEKARWYTNNKMLYVLTVDGQPVTMAGTTRQMPHGRSVGPVYTPPYLRGHGYATSAVAQLSKLILSLGNRYCTLFTDLSNPTSNSIYRKIGYKPLFDYVEIAFSPSRSEDS